MDLDPENIDIVELNKIISQEKVKIYAHIARQREVLEFLEYSLEQKQARSNHQVYIRFLSRNSDSIYAAVRALTNAERLLDQSDD